MAEVKHTPGPWLEIETESSVDHEWADGGRIGGWQDIGPEGGEAVAVVLFRDGSDHFGAEARGEANARLIAIAPYLGATDKNDWRGLDDDDAISMPVKIRVGDLRGLKAALSKATTQQEGR